MKRYGADMMAWRQSKSVRAEENHKMAMFQSSKELHELMKDAMVLYHEVTDGHIIRWGQKMNKDGSADTWIANRSARHLFESLYELAWDLRKLAESKMARKQRRLEKLTLNDPNFQRAFSKLQDDTDIHSWNKFGRTVEKTMKGVEEHLKHCPQFKRFMGILMRMRMTVESEKVVSDMGRPQEWVNWWNENNFQNPFDGMKMDDEEEEFLI